MLRFLSMLIYSCIYIVTYIYYSCREILLSNPHFTSFRTHPYLFLATVISKILCFGSWYHDFHSVLDSINKTVKAYPDPWRRFLSDLLILVCNCFLLSSFFLICIFDDEDTFVYLWENEKEWEKLVLVA